MPTRKRHRNSLYRAMYDFILLVSGGGIGAMLALYYEKTLPGNISGLAVLLSSVPIMVLTIVVLYLLRRDYDIDR